MNIVSVIAISGALFGFLLASALLRASASNQYANKVLAIFVVVSSLYLVAVLPLHNKGIDIPRWTRAGILTILLFGPLLLAYVKAMTQESFRIRASHLVHTLPIFLVLIIGRPIVEKHGGDIAVLAAQTGWPPNFLGLLALFFYCHLSSYFGFALRDLRKHAQRVDMELSYQEGVNLSWLRILVSICMGIALLGLAISLARIFSDAAFWPRGIYSMSLMFAVFYLIAFMAIVQPAIFNQLSTDLNLNPGEQGDIPASEHGTVTKAYRETLDDVSADTDVTAIAKTVPQYETSSLTTDMAQDYWHQLTAYMGEHKPYLNNELRIKDLAEGLNIASNHLSQVINQHAEKNFYEFVNEYRVEEAKHLLADKSKDKLNINHIALESGFNSQSAFYKQFKKYVGKTPKQYRNQLE